METIRSDRQKINCPLCGSESETMFKNIRHHFYRCSVCGLIFRDPENRPNLQEEKSRYEEHNNDVNNKGYQRFVSPIVHAVLRDWMQEDLGLDFGAGTGPVISKLLKDAGYQIKQYDPFFHIFPELLEKSYHYIACCEVAEHFYQPYREFMLLKKLLKEGGRLYIMTYLYTPEIDFASWNYKDDQTHVCIYQKKSIEWIQEHLGFSDLRIENRLITLTK
ncbi:MAG: methyltransferase domain-containing protein [Spirochaetales bacterium]|nr:methyltransferase domain-containing protein [Spirochaetales bacterium]